MDKVTYDIIPHTIFLTVGPSGCGKTYFCKNILIPQLEKLSPQVNRNKVSINYVSSDDIRRNLLGQPDLDKNHYGMLTASKPAFDLLYAQVDAATTFPVNSEFVIVDTKGTNENFRKKIFDIAYKTLNQTNEEKFLEPLYELVQQGITPADLIIKNFEGVWQGNIEKLVQYLTL